MHIKDALGYINVDAWVSDNFPDHIYCTWGRPGANMSLILTLEQAKAIVAEMTAAMQQLEAKNES